MLSLTCHAITEDFRRECFILKCETFDDRHTGDIISEKLKAMLAEWEIDTQKVHCIIRDGGSNMVRAMKLADLQDMDCTVHQIQLCVRAALESSECLSNLVARCRKIATHFSHSLVAQAEFRKIQEVRLNQQVLSVVQDCSTR